MDLDKVAAGEYGEQEEIAAEEDPAFQRRLRENRSVAPHFRFFACFMEHSMLQSTLEEPQQTSWERDQPFILAVEVGRSQHGK